MFSVIVDANLIVQLVIQIKNCIMKHVNVSVEIMARAKEVIVVGILAHVFLKIVGI